MNGRVKTFSLGLLVAATLSGVSCSAMKDLAGSLTNLSRCKFKIDALSDFRLAGVSLGGKTSISLIDGLSLGKAFADGRLPAAFTLNIAAVNPNDGTAGRPRSSAVLAGLAWKLYLDDKETIAGDIASPVTLPGTGEQTLIPLRMELDLMKFFNDRGYDSIVKLALALGGAQGSASRVTLKATPTVRTDFGSITYPGQIAIIDREFRGE
jgi:hypothetical protein